MIKAKRSVADTIKDLVADPVKKIRLDDYVTDLLKATIENLSSDVFWPPPPTITPSTIQDRLHKYEKSIEEIMQAVILLGRWGREDQLSLLEKIFLRFADANKSSGGLMLWQSMRWYPLSLLAYSAGIAALSARNYPVLRSTILTLLPSANGSEGRKTLAVQMADEINAIVETFKALPGHERQHTPRSEYYLEVVRPSLEELLYLGDSYESYFDEFEIIAALVYADLTQKSRGRIWAMPGRFGWKHAYSDHGPYNMLVAEAEAQGAAWPPLQVGLFGSQERFVEIANGYRDVIGRMNFH